MVKDTPRQDILPPLSTGLLWPSPGAGALFPQPRMADGVLMDERHGQGWRLVRDGCLPVPPLPAGVTAIDIRDELDGVAAAWMRRHECHAALLRPDHYVFGSAADDAALKTLLEQRNLALT